MVKWIKNVLFGLEVWWYTKNLKEFFMYRNKKHNAYIMLNPDDKLLQVFVGGLLFKIPLDMNVTDDVSRENALDAIADLNLDQNSVDDLKSILAIYEEEEDFEKCKEIQEIIKKKINEKIKKS